MGGQAIQITASMLYNSVECPHRVSQDYFEDRGKRDQISPFTQLLWERGNAFEKDVIAGLAQPIVDLSTYSGAEKEAKTLEAMDAKVPLIYGARISADDLLGDPDLLRLEECGYVPGDIKSGSAEEGAEDNEKPKIRYAVQLGIYLDILQRMGRSTSRRGFIWDIHGKEVYYDFSAPLGKKDPKTLWEEYQAHLERVRSIVTKERKTLPALASLCKQCHWHSACRGQLEASNDLTLLPDLGRARRDVIAPSIPTVTALARTDVTPFIQGKKTAFQGIGPDTLLKFKDRAILLSTPGAKPYTRAPIELPQAQTELFFDIETDPMLDLCYLHGFVVRKDGDNSTEQYVGIFVEGTQEKAEEEGFRRAWQFISKAMPCAIYYYSAYEKSFYRALQRKYPAVCSVDDIENLFARPETIDLYNDVVRKHTEWPTNDHSIKTLAKYLGFKWRDADPSGASSIEWFQQWAKTGDEEHKVRILEYNEDDCRATRVLLDALRSLPTRTA